MYKDTTKLFINDLKFSSVAKLLREAVEHEAGHSVFTDSCSLIGERAAGTEHTYNGVSVNQCEQLLISSLFQSPANSVASHRSWMKGSFLYIVSP